MDRIQRYADEWLPEEIRVILKALGNETRMAIISFLYEEEPTTFVEIMKGLGLKSNKLSYHLRILSQAGLIDRYYTREGGRERITYTLSDLGRHVYESAPVIFIPREALVREVIDLKAKDMINMSMTTMQIMDKLPR